VTGISDGIGTLRDKAGDNVMDEANDAVRVNVVAGGAGDGSILDGVSSAIKATVLDYASSNPVAVRLTDTGGDYVSAGAGTQYTVDAALGATPTGTLAVAIRDDALGALTPVEGDAIGLRVDANGALWTHDDALDAALAGSELQVDVVGALPTGTNVIGSVKITDGSDVALVTAGGLLQVDGSGVTQPISAAALPLPTGAATSALQTQPGTDIGDVTVNNGAGAAAVNVQDGGNALTVDGTIAVSAVSGTVQIIGELAHDAVSGTNGVLISGYASAAAPANVSADGDVARAWVLRNGASAVNVTAAGALIGGDAANGLDVDVTRLPALVASSANIGDVDVLTIAAGDNNIGNVDIVTLPALVTGSATIGAVTGPTADNATNPTLKLGVLPGVALAAAPTRTEGNVNPLRLNLAGDVAITLDSEAVVLGAGAATIGAVNIAAAQTLATVTTVSTVTNVSQQGGVAISLNTGVRDTGTQRVTIATNDVVPVTDNAGSLTVDWAGTAPPIGAGVEATALRVTVATDSTGVLTVKQATAANLKTEPAGQVAHAAADSGNPLKIGAKVETSPKGITLAADGNRSDLYADADGMLMVKLNTAYGDLISERVSNTDGAATAFTTFSAVASTRNYVTAITVHNAHATTNGYVDIRDGTAGSVLWTLPLPATGGAVQHFNPPLRQPTANTALAFDVSAAITTVYVSVNGFQSKA